MRAGRNQNWILAAFVAGSAALAMKSNATRGQCGPSGCGMPIGVRLLEAEAAERLGLTCETNAAVDCVVQPHVGK